MFLSTPLTSPHLSSPSTLISPYNQLLLHPSLPLTPILQPQPSRSLIIPPLRSSCFPFTFPLSPLSLPIPSPQTYSSFSPRSFLYNYSRSLWFHSYFPSPFPFLTPLLLLSLPLRLIPQPHPLVFSIVILPRAPFALTFPHFSIPLPSLPHISPLTPFLSFPSFSPL